jgi:hypothetical protein
MPNTETIELERLRAERDAESARYDEAMATLAAVRQDQERALQTVERLRAALTLMLESFTEPEDDNDILRQARAALDA